MVSEPADEVEARERDETGEGQGGRSDEADNGGQRYLHQHRVARHLPLPSPPRHSASPLSGQRHAHGHDTRFSDR